MKSFARLWKMECRKALGNRFFVITLCVGSFFCLISALYNVEAYYQGQQQLKELGGNPMTQAFGLFNSWIGGEQTSLGYLLFFTLFPLLAICPYGWSQCLEKKSGYTKMVIVRGGKQSYYLAKYLATFLSGVLVVLTPLTLNLVITACFVPAVKPSVMYQIYYSISHATMWSELFYEHPLIYVLLYLFIDCIFAGLFAVCGMAFSILLKNRIAVVILPYLCILGLHYGRALLYNRVYIEISPINFLHPTCIENPVNGAVVLLEGTMLALFSFLILKVGVKNESY